MRFPLPVTLKHTHCMHLGMSCLYRQHIRIWSWQPHILHGSSQFRDFFKNILFKNTAIIPAKFSFIFRKSCIEIHRIPFISAASQHAPKSYYIFSALYKNRIITFIYRNFYKSLFVNHFVIYRCLCNFFPIYKKLHWIMYSNCQYQLSCGRTVKFCKCKCVISIFRLRKLLIKIQNASSVCISLKALFRKRSVRKRQRRICLHISPGNGSQHLFSCATDIFSFLKV